MPALRCRENKGGTIEMIEIGNVDLNRLVAEMRSLASRTGGGHDVTASTSIEATGAPVDFSQVFKAAVNQVNGMQQESAAMAQAFERGDPSVDVAELMVAMQKSSIAFQAMTEVRNRLIRAYQDVMSMGV